jgi:hypothetical protein
VIALRVPASTILPGASLALVLSLATLAFAAGRADAIILPAQTIDGPNENIVGFGGVAMAEDGTGGLVYLKRVGGVAHVFVSRYAGGAWLAPIQVDTQNQFGASWPTIGAADGGELIVAWATPFATEHAHPVYNLVASELGPGSQAFGPPEIVDPDIGEATGTSPQLAVSSTGFADIAYRVVNFSSTVPLLRPGDVVESVRVANFDGYRWSSLGTVNRAPGLSMRAPTAANAPKIALGPTGNGIVVWQEPEATGTARIWARRIFGRNLDYVRPLTATEFEQRPITTEADAPSVAISRLGQAAVAYRQSWAPGSPLPGPRIFINVLTDGEEKPGTEFLGAKVADEAVSGGTGAAVGRPSVDVDERHESRLLYDSNGKPRVIEENDQGVQTPLAVGSPFGASPCEPPFSGSQLEHANELSAASVMNPEGGGVSAWPSRDCSGRLVVSVREDFPGGAVQTGLVSGGAGGPIAELAVGRSGLGDGVVAFQQGALGDAAIVASVATAPPEPFVATGPKGRIRGSRVTISWSPAESANGPISYSVVLDGHLVAHVQGLSYRFKSGELTGGDHETQVLATDIFGQAALTPEIPLEIAGPTASVASVGAATAAVIKVRDSGPGLVLASVKVSFGDGHRAAGRRRFVHRYAYAGTYEVVVTARDRLGLRMNVRRRLRVR